jgi:hypothetical protein
VHVGPIHTLHRPDGTPAADQYWYEPDYSEPSAQFKPNDWNKLDQQRRWAIRKLRGLSYRQDLRRLIGRYAAALSRSDPNVAFLQMWSILESITNTVGARYEDTVRRAAWVFPDSGSARDALEYLRCCRNQYVHAARSDENRAQVAQLVKSFVDPHLIHLLRNDLRVRSLEEYAGCLSLPTSVDGLVCRHRHVAQALRIRRSWSKSE